MGIQNVILDKVALKVQYTVVVLWHGKKVIRRRIFL